MKWWRRWRERRRSAGIRDTSPGQIERQPRSSEPYAINETPFHKLVDQADPENPSFGYPELFGATQEDYWEYYQANKISLDQYKALGQLFYKTRNKQLSPAQITDEYLDIMGETDG